MKGKKTNAIELQNETYTQRDPYTANTTLHMFAYHTHTSKKEKNAKDSLNTNTDRERERI